MIVWYAPTEDAEEADKDAFYDQLQSVTDEKGDLGNCDNWRGVTLLPITSKVFSKIIHTRLAEAVDEYTRQEQAGFRPGCSCSDHIFTPRQI